MTTTLGDALRAAIHRRELTASTLAHRSNVSVDSIQRFLNGERGLRLATLEKLCADMGLTLVDTNSYTVFVNSQ